jgi:hypothetical protein
MLLALYGGAAFAESQSANIEKGGQENKIEILQNAAPIMHPTENTVLPCTCDQSLLHGYAGNNNTNQKEAEVAINDRIATYTMWLAIVGLLQIALIGMQVILLRKTLRATENAANAAQKSAQVAENALTVVAQPYICVFGVTQLRLNPKSGQLSVAYEVGNFGKTPAIIEVAQIALESIESNLNAILEVDRRHSLVVAPVLSSGEVRHGLVKDIPENMLKTTNIDGVIAPDMKDGDELFFRAIIHYRGIFTQRRIGSFCWIYNTYTAHFEPYGHDDYNYTT